MYDLPENYDINKYDRPSVAVDIVVFTARKSPCESYRHLSKPLLSVLMTVRTEPPFKGMLSLPGGFTVRTETIEQTAQRKLLEKTGVSGLPLSMLCNSSALGRDPRGWIISCGYSTLVEFSKVKISEETAGWYDISLDYCETGKLTLTSDSGAVHTVMFRQTGEKTEIIDNGGIAFDHAQIIIKGVAALQNSLKDPDSVFKLLPTEFTLSDLQMTYEAILGRQLLTPNFRRKIAPYVEETGRSETGAGHRPSKLFRAKKRDEDF